MSRTTLEENVVIAGVVAIGRNEGQRLEQCLRSVLAAGAAVVYVDSGSSDGSAELAAALGVEVIRLHDAIPFTAARARNEGFRRLRSLWPEVRHVQFVDGDCELARGWMEKGAAFLAARPDVAAVCGRLRERFPQRSVYNLLCDIEWDRPVGEASACGGVAMLRAGPFETVGGFRAELIAGEEPELCARLRSGGWRVWRLGDEMALHDAAMSRFGQWWRRSVRAGFAAAQALALQGGSPERRSLQRVLSACLWSLGPPLAAAVLALVWGKWALCVLLLYPAQVVRLALRGGRSRRENWWYATFLVIGRFAETAGQATYLGRRWFAARPRLIEYK